MFIRERVKKNRGFKKRYIYHYLIESYRNNDGNPRQRNLLSLGKLSLPKQYWKTLADRIEEIVTNQERLIDCTPEVEHLARHYASMLIEKRSAHTQLQENEHVSPPDYETVDLNTICQDRVRTIGAENVAWEMVSRLNYAKIFEDCGIRGINNITACILIAARMVHPASELGTYEWLNAVSGLYDLAGCKPEDISLARLYRVSDVIRKRQDKIEQGLRAQERELFKDQDTIYLYDLTNTYFEAPIGHSSIKRYGKSKEKRTDCPLIALGVVYNRSGFPLKSQVFKGDVSDQATLGCMLQSLAGDCETSKPSDPPTVVIDAGIATEANLKLLKEMQYEYVCVARNKPLDRSQIDLDKLITIRNSKDNLIEAQLHQGEEENILFCRSRKRGLKDRSIKTRFIKRFEQELESIRNGLFKKHCTKQSGKVHERIGRVREKYSRVAHYYTIKVETEGDLAVDITWEQKDPEALDDRFAGTYFLRTSRTDLNENQLWQLYILLTDAEDGFRSLKSELGLRPNFHKKDRRIETHAFITVLAYHAVQAMQWYLHQSDIYMRWSHIRTLLSSQARITTCMRTQDNRTVYIQNTSEPEEFHRIIADALSISARPLKRQKRKS